jgi:hypothetical protein
MDIISLSQHKAVERTLRYGEIVISEKVCSRQYWGLRLLGTAGGGCMLVYMLVPS